MRRIILILVVLLSFAVPAASGQEDERAEGAGMNVWVPDGWQVTETDDALVLTNLPADKPDWLATIEPGRVTAHLVSLHLGDENDIPTSNPAFLAGIYMGTALTMRSVLVAFSGADSSSEVIYTIGEPVEENGLLWADMTIGGAKPADLLVVVVGEDFVMTASAPGGELTQWRDLLFEIAAKSEADL